MGRNPPRISYDHHFLKFAGYVPNLVKYLNAGDVAIAPILSGGGTKLKIFQYLAAGTPLVATKKAVEGIQGLKNGESALLSEEVDQRFIDNILRVHDDSRLRRKLSDNARKLAERYDWKTIASKLYDVYEDLVSTR
jgi:glycosyltransferase involved in cell wall biosynthesis